MNASLQALRYYLPEGVLSNQALHEQFPEWSVDKIARKTGIRNRHIAAEDETAADLAVRAAQKLFAEANIAPKSIDFLLFCTQSPDYFLPTTACLLQDRLGIPTSAGALDFNLGCSGFVYGLSMARGFIAGGDAKNVLLLTADTYSKFIHPEDKSVKTLFGDAAAASLISADHTPSNGLPGGGRIGQFVFGTNGKGAPNLIVPTGGMRAPRTAATAEVYADRYGSRRDGDSLYMNGKEIYHFTLDVLPTVIEDLYAKTGLQQEDIDLFVFHQANQYMIEKVREKMGIPSERFYVHLEDCGNTVSSTIPIALHHALADGTIKPGTKVMLVGFGVGYSWSACIVEY